MKTARSPLDRTVRLCRYLVPHVAPDAIVDALTSMTVTLVVDAANAVAGACQSALVTLAQLVMQMGCSVHLVGPDVALSAPQPPWRGETLWTVLKDMASESIPGVIFTASDEYGNIIFAFGDTPCSVPGAWRIGASTWSGTIKPGEESGARWTGDFPLGGLAAATMAASETFKMAMRALGPSGPHIDEVAPVRRARVVLSDKATPMPSNLGRVDCVGGGAITQAALHALRRVPSLAAVVRVIEPQRSELTDLNRYGCSRRSQIGDLKTEILARLSTPLFTITGEPMAFDEQSALTLGPLAPRVIVGTDNVPSRWVVQKQRPKWLVVGATSEFMAMTSEHDGTGGCAACVHPYDDGVRTTIPTLSFVSYWAGLMVASRTLRHAAGVVEKDRGEVSLIASLRLDSPFGELRYANLRSPQCPMHCSGQIAA
jgi:hypothetical protein